MTFGISFRGERWNIIPIPSQLDERALKELIWKWAGQYPQLARDSDQVRIKIAQLRHENNVYLGAHQQENLVNEIVARYSFQNSQAR